MKGDPEQRAVQLGEYIAANRATVRAAAAVFGCSKSTVHKDVAVRPPGANTAADKRRHTSEQNGSCAVFFRFSPGCGTGSVRLFPTG